MVGWAFRDKILIAAIFRRRGDVCPFSTEKKSIATLFATWISADIEVSEALVSVFLIVQIRFLMSSTSSS